VGTTISDQLVRDDFSKQTVTELGKGAGYRCSNPDCRRSTIGANAEQDGSITIGVAAHICAASPGGPRYDSAQTQEARRAKANGIWLCQNCARLIDTDERKFTVELLVEWKCNAQERSFRELVAPAAGVATEEAARVGLLIAAENAGAADPDFDAVFAMLHAAASADIAAFKRTPVWSGESVELTLRIFDDAKTPPFTISRLPLAVEVAPEVTVIAPPGTGKTITFLQLAEHMLADAAIVPVYFRLGDWAAETLPLLASLHRRPAFSAVAQDDVLRLAERGRLLLLFDGWNEVDQAARRRLRVELGQLRRNYPDTRIIITTRRQMLDVPVSGPRIAIEPLSEEQEMAIAHAHLGAAGQKIVDDAWRTPGVRELIAIPLYLSGLLSGGSSGAHPTTKDEVLRLFVRQHEQAGDHAEALQTMLFGCHTEILTALACHLNAIGSTTMPDADARRIVTTAIAQLREQGQLSGQPEPFAVLELLSAHHTLMRSGHDGGLAFQHQQFQEWYASHKVAGLMRASVAGSAVARETLRVEILDQPAWEESILFAIERLSREQGAEPAAAHAVRLALPIDPMLAAEMIYRAAQAVWEIVTAEIVAFADRWHRPRAVDRAVRSMIMTGRTEFAPHLWPLVASENTQIQLPALRAAPRFRPAVLGPGLQNKIAALPEKTREDLLGSIASQSGVDGMDLATELAKVDPSAAVQEDVVGSLLFRRAYRHAKSLLDAAHDATWALVARRGYANEIDDPAIATRLRDESAKALAQATDPAERLRLLLKQPPDHPGRNADIVAAIADAGFPVRDQHAGSTLLYAYQRAPEVVLVGLRQRLEARMDLPFHADDLLDQLPVTDEGPIPDAILDVGNDDRRLNAVAVLAGPKTVAALVNKYIACVEALRSARNDRNLNDEYQRLRSRIEATRAPLLITAVLAHAEADDPTIIAALAFLVFLHGGHESRTASVAIDPEHTPQVIDMLHRWADRVITAADAERYHLSEVASAIGRVGFRKLVPDLKRLLDEDLARLKKARDGFLDAQRRGDIHATSDARTLYTYQYREAFARLGGEEVAAIVAHYLESRVFGLEAALILKVISDRQLNVSQPDLFRRWPWFDDVAAVRASRASGLWNEPENILAAPIFAAIDRLASSGTDREGQLLAIGLTRIALAMPHADHDTLVARVMALPQPIKAKQELLAAMVLDGQVLNVDVVMQGIDEWLVEAAKDAWNKRQNTWEIEPLLELLPFSTRPGAVIEGLTKVKAFYGAGWPKHWERVLNAVARLPGDEGDALLAELARLHSDIANDYEWMKAILGRNSAAAVLLFIDLFTEGRFGRGHQGIDAWHAGRELGSHVATFPQLKPGLRQRYEESSGTGRALLEHLFEEWGGEDDLIAMVKKYASAGQHYDGLMERVVHAVALRREPAPGRSGAFYIHPASVSRVRKILFGLLEGATQEATLAKSCLTAIDVLRDEYGIAANDTRHPDVQSAVPWPLEVAASKLDPSLLRQ
jgi:hypothetical protein